MIVPMKSVTLLALASDESSALEALRGLGVMQLLHTERCSAAAQSSAELLGAVRRVRQQLELLRPEDAASSSDNSVVRGKTVVETAEKLFDRKAELENRSAVLTQRLNRLAVWGDFQKETLEELEKKGVSVLLCSGSVDEFSVAETLEDVSVFVIRRSRDRVDFAAVATGGFSEETVAALPVFKLAEDDDPAGLQQEKDTITAQLLQLDEELTALSCEDGAVESYCRELEDQYNFDRAADAMSEHGAIAVLRGFVPEPELDALREEAKKQGWGLFIRDPKEDEEVPVLLKNNKFTRIIKPLFDFLGIAPGYWEIDISGGVLIFFTIFYAIIIGDAGYGVLFGLISLSGLLAARKKPALKAPMRLLLLLSIAATIWGALCGSWFGLSQIGSWQIPALKCFRDFASSTAKQANVQFFCFILAVLQISTGRIWRAIRERSWRALVQHLGWILIVWGNFFLTIRLIVYPGEFPVYMYYLYGIGLALVIVCGVNWKNPAAVFQFPFDIIGSFTDVLSYIRLFAVGLAGACIAGSFNNMAFDVSSISVLLIPAGVLVALAGHLLNIALAFLSVLVHAVRLNTLEFANHVGLSWSGQSFNPFKKIYKDKE